MCSAQVELSVNGKLYHPMLDWLHQRPDGGLAVAGAEQGDWRLISWGAAWMLGSSED